MVTMMIRIEQRIVGYHVMPMANLSGAFSVGKSTPNNCCPECSEPMIKHELWVCQMCTIIRRIICRLIGHHWRVVGYRTMNPYHVCKRCGAISIAKVFKPAKVSSNEIKK